MAAKEDVVFETDRHWVKRVPKGFEVYKIGLTHSTRVATIHYLGDKGLQRAKLEIERRESSSEGLKMAKRKKTITPSRRYRHAEFMVETLGPDLVESGRVHTGEDVIRCGKLMLAGKKDPKFARFLTGTLIPDLRAAGQKLTANDLARCARAIGGTKRRR